MCRCNFRIKLDLSKYYDDVRRSSWIYVDKGSITCICHLQKHITKVFDIQNPFHLLLKTGEYLPPNEDARILKEDETILVVPGTGLQKSYPNLQKTVTDVQITSNRVVPQQKQCNSDSITSNRAVPQQKQCNLDSIISADVKAPESTDDEENLATPLETTNENTVFLSMINDPEMETEAETKPDLSTLGESVASEPSPLKNKRKRTRRKMRSRNLIRPEEETAVSVNEGIQVEYKKPKIINSVTIQNGKHIRFGDVEKVEAQGYDSSASNDSKKIDKNRKDHSYWDKPMAGSNLANLLALGQSSTPITFVRKQISEGNGNSIPQGNIEKYESKENLVGEREIPNKNGLGLIVDPRKHPLMDGKARVNDIIAFKMLKMGSDYTPQVSEYIIAQPIQILSDRSTYMFKILEGKSEVQTPQGKFDIEIAETENTETSDLIALNWSQLIEPRLIYVE